jgi:hypothetical protein
MPHGGSHSKDGRRDALGTCGAIGWLSFVIRWRARQFDKTRGRRRTPRGLLGLHRRRSDSSALDCGGDGLLWAKGRASPVLRASNTILLARRMALEVGFVSAGLRHRSAQILNDETIFVPATYRDHDLSCDCHSPSGSERRGGEQTIDIDGKEDAGGSREAPCMPVQRQNPSGVQCFLLLRIQNANLSTK